MDFKDHKNPSGWLYYQSCIEPYIYMIISTKEYLHNCPIGELRDEYDSDSEIDDKDAMLCIAPNAEINFFPGSFPNENALTFYDLSLKNREGTVEINKDELIELSYIE